jgi:hypothetical protein
MYVKICMIILCKTKISFQHIFVEVKMCITFLDISISAVLHLIFVKLIDILVEMVRLLVLIPVMYKVVIIHLSCISPINITFYNRYLKMLKLKKVYTNQKYRE